MKKHSLLLLLALPFLLLPACNKKHANFFVNYTTSATIPTANVSETGFSVHAATVATIIDDKCAPFNTRKGKIESVYLKQLRLTVSDTANPDFSFAQSVKVYIHSPGLNEVLVAELDSVPVAGGDTLLLSVIQTDLKNYLIADKFSWRLEFIADQPLAQSIATTVYSSFMVRAKVNRIKKKK